MPSLQDIEQFKEYLNSLGNEPAILAERGQTIKDVEKPEEGLSEDLSDLLGTAGGGGAEEGVTDAGGEEAPEEGLDMLPDDFLDTGDEDLPEEGRVEEEFGLPDFEEAAGEETLDLGGTEEAAGEEAFDLGGIEEPAEEGEAEEEFGLPDFEEAEPAEEVGGEEALDLGGLEEPAEEGGAEEFGLPDFEEAEPEEGGAEEEFGLPDFEEAEPAEEAGGEEALDLGGLEEPAEEGGAEEEFGLPDFEVAAEEEALDLGGLEEPAEGSGTEEEFGLPDFEEAEPEAGEAEEEFGLPDFEEAEPAEEGETGEEEFGLPDFEEAAGEEALDLGGAEEVGGEEEFEIPLGGEEGAAGEAAEGEEEALPAEFLEDDDLGNLEDLEDEGFNLDFDELGDHFGIAGEEAVEEAAAEPAAMEERPAAVGVEDLHEGEEDYEIEDEEFEAVKKTLGELPRNLKLAIEELIGEKGLSGDRLRALMKLMMGGASAKEIAAQVSRITGKKIEIPVQYERKTGVEFEAEKGTFRYALRQNILPMLRIFVPAALAALLLIFIGVRFVYRPLKARSLYQTGYEEIYEERFDSANSYFDRAYEVHRVKKWFYEYAEGFIDQRKYHYAEEKYQQLLKDYPDERDGRLDLAELQGMTLGKYEEAEEQLGILLREDRYDQDALLLSGDMYMQWAITAPEHYEDARLAYAKLIEAYGRQDEYLFRMLRYFIRTDNYREVVRLKQTYEAAPDVEVDPQVYAELGGYLLDKGELDDVQDILFRAMDVNKTVPDIHYHLARLFRKNQEYSEEQKALNNAIYYLEAERARDPFHEGMLIDSYTRRGEYLYSEQKYLDAEKLFSKAREHYEQALDMRILAPEPKYGRIYSHLGDLYYYQDGDLDTAEGLYNLAETHAYRTPELDFKRGYIHFQREDFKKALLRFYDAGEGFSTNENLLYATANALYERGDFFAAEGYYDHLIDILENQKKNVSHFLIDERPDHRALVENLMKAYNNQGVTMYNLSLKTGDQTKVGDALYYFTESIELYDYLSRDQETMESAETVNLAYLNSRSILYPVGNYQLQIYRDIPRDMHELFY